MIVESTPLLEEGRYPIPDLWVATVVARVVGKARRSSSNR